jgi:SAM-dependent methyltransferase
MASVISVIRFVGGVTLRNTIGTLKEQEPSDSARYSYSVWLRHLVRLYQNGIHEIPEKVIEFGPGNSLGTGLCALLSGTKQYRAFDAFKHVGIQKNTALFEEIIKLFEMRAGIPDETEFPHIHPKLDSYDFPAQIVTEDVIKSHLNESRLNQIRKELQNIENPDNTFIRYTVPWHTAADIPPNSIDMIYSQSVMEYVDNLDKVYPLMFRWLKPGGVISHEIDFTGCGAALTWNGHWGYSDWMWKLVKGKASFVSTRFPHSLHMREIKKSGFEILCDDYVTLESDLKKDQINKGLIHLFEDNDLYISSAFIQAVKPGRKIF